MKRRFFFILLCVTVAACAMVEQFANDLNLTLSRGATTFAPTPVWKGGDAVKVLSSTRKSGKIFNLSSGSGLADGVFAGEKPGSAPFVVTYPSALEVSFLSGTSFSATFPQVQKFVEGGYDTDACLYAASADGSGAVRLLCPMALLELPLQSQKSILSLSLNTPDGHPLCGEASIALNGYPAVSFSQGASCTLTLNCGKGILPGSQTTVFRFLLPPDALDAGASLSITDIEGGAMSLTIDPVSLGIGEVLTLPETQYARMAPPYLSVTVPGLYSINRTGNAVQVFAYEALSDQIALRETADGIQWRLQRLSDAKVLSLSLPKRRESIFDAQCSAVGNISCPKGSLVLTPVQNKDGLEWYIDTNASTLFIVKTLL